MSDKKAIELTFEEDVTDDTEYCVSGTGEGSVEDKGVAFTICGLACFAIVWVTIFSIIDTNGPEPLVCVHESNSGCDSGRLLCETGNNSTSCLTCDNAFVMITNSTSDSQILRCENLIEQPDEAEAHGCIYGCADTANMNFIQRVDSIVQQYFLWLTFAPAMIAVTICVCFHIALVKHAALRTLDFVDIYRDYAIYQIYVNRDEPVLAWIAFGTMIVGILVITGSFILLWKQHGIANTIVLSTPLIIFCSGITFVGIGLKKNYEKIVAPLHAFGGVAEDLPQALLLFLLLGSELNNFFIILFLATALLSFFKILGVFKGWCCSSEDEYSDV